MKSAILLLVVALLGGCATRLPPQQGPVSFVRQAAAEAPLLQLAESLALTSNTDLSAFSLLTSGKDALAARLQLIDMAESGIDLQYYIFKGDTTGGLLALRLLAAADRGVQVRLLVDDIGNSMGDFKIASLDRHPNIEIRLFNPLTLRDPWLRYASKVGEFGRINHRMHNKLMVVDGMALITGGRNLGDEYFALSERDFQDIDVLAIGPVAASAAMTFDVYWNSHKSVAVAGLVRAPGSRALHRLRRQLDSLRVQQEQTPWQQAVASSSFRGENALGKIEWLHGSGWWLADPPDKADPFSSKANHPALGLGLAELGRATREELLMMTAYFIPGRDGMQVLREFRHSGMQVGILTNSLATTDVLAVHSAYAGYRTALLEAGLHLWELQPIAAQQERASTFAGDSQASLHAKSFIFDRERVFIGSLNLDPRSIHLNTEAGVLIEQPELAGQMYQLFQRWTDAEHAWKLGLDERGELYWQAGEQILRGEPEAGWWRRLNSWLLGWLPIERQL
ncbi:phospholipase D family protein [Halopseudomonas yangmingensis]|uniref:Putative cardiolipin synthase n=1 Tax=Halopseudomonas yangmingensis TaxID=1720063 RepID=A0A1I4RQT9_9GAMM|nr:phospholipase D family protein [Halopseudomonas yangmingensis]SFM54565.1 putative cardiolipin synthase [Halopseudomonas yangmingensis]